METPPSEPSSSRLDSLRRALPSNRRILIVPHDFPDPDAIASAAAIHWLLDKHFGIQSQIAFSGDVSRAENKELLRRLKCRWHRLEDLNLRGVSEHDCILVDTAPWSRNVTLPPGAVARVVIDHHEHKSIPDLSGAHIDIRGEAGATATLALEYLEAAGVDIPRWLAAVMAYAIVSETLDLTREVSAPDLKAYLSLVAKADLRIIGRIRHAPLSRVYFVRLQEALSRARVLRDVAWTHLSAIEQPEMAAEVADLLLRMEGIRWSFCTAELPGRLFVSLRSSRRAASCNRIIRAAIGRNGAAGGHDKMAAGYLETGGAAGLELEERRIALVRQLLRRMGIRNGAGPIEEAAERLIG
ncbi:MAG: DHH family phosphoesterase [Kiritimatiellae bacterium]|nr:DHH family phosphoesterase [Kiritimatiellia bacterium]MDW8458303.1 DHH family phosphoesterase [Verrucomicrobiota bacterium]